MRRQRMRAPVQWLMNEGGGEWENGPGVLWLWFPNEAWRTQSHWKGLERRGEGMGRVLHHSGWINCLGAEDKCGNAVMHPYVWCNIQWKVTMSACSGSTFFTAFQNFTISLLWNIRMVSFRHTSQHVSSYSFCGHGFLCSSEICYSQTMSHFKGFSLHQPDSKTNLWILDCVNVLHQNKFIQRD